VLWITARLVFHKEDLFAIVYEEDTYRRVESREVGRKAEREEKRHSLGISNRQSLPLT
jgi:hypothetical protein